MVVAVVDEVIRDGVTVAGIELFEQRLRNLFLLELDLADEIIRLSFPKFFEL